MSVAASPAAFSVVEFDRARRFAPSREGLRLRPKRLPAWLFYDAAGSRLFDAITELPEYYLTRTERGILAAHARERSSRKRRAARGCASPSWARDRPTRRVCCSKPRSTARERPL